MATDLELAYNALTIKKPIYDRLFGYYDNNQPLVYSSERLRQIFKDIDARFTQNWCAVVVDSVLERIQLRQFTIANSPEMEDGLKELVAENELTLESDDVHLAALVCGEAFVIAWPDEEGNPQAYYNDPRNVHVFYEADNPREMRFAAKWWRADDGRCYLNLYYADHIEYYETRRKVEKPSDLSSAKAFQPAEMPTDDNPYGMIPVFHFRRERRVVKSELTNVVEPQDAINKLLNDMMIAAEFGAFPQRWAITNTELSKLKNAPSQIWKVPPAEQGEQPVQLGQFATTDLANYIQGIDKFANAIAIITRTPKHYFFNSGSDPSGEALIAMESPLNKKCQKYIDRFSVVWRSLAQFMLLIAGADVQATDIAPVFDKPETIQPRTGAEIVQIETASGIPLTTSLRDQGWTQAELDQMEEDKANEQKAQSGGLGTALVNAMRQFDQGGQRNGQPVTNGQPVNQQMNGQPAMNGQQTGG
jgi:hypothetical protein